MQFRNDRNGDGGESIADPNAHAYTDINADAYAITYRYQDAYAHSYTNAHPISYADGNAHANTYTDTYAISHADAYTHINADAYPHTSGHAYTITLRYGNAYADTYPNAYVNSIAYTHGYTDTVHRKMRADAEAPADSRTASYGTTDSRGTRSDNCQIHFRCDAQCGTQHYYGCRS